MLKLNVDSVAGDWQTQLLYCGLDSAATLELFKILEPKLDEHTSVTYEHERRLLGPYFEMTQRGIKIDLAARDKFLASNGGALAELRAWWKELCLGVFDHEINMNSAQQLKKLFYDDMGIPPITQSKKGVVTVTTNRKALEKIVEKYERGAIFALTILKLRDLESIEEVLTKGLLDGRWMFSLNIAGTETGRRSSNMHPFRIGANIQNIAKPLRHLFIPDDGYVLVQVDQQGAESRNVAYLSGDENYIKAVESGDVHTQVSAMVFGFAADRKLAERTYYREKTYRDIGKMGGHASNYEVTPRTTAIQGKIEVKIAEEFQEKYFKTFPMIRQWQGAVRKTLQTPPHVLVTPFGRKRRFWGRPWDDATAREAIAFCPQSMTGELSSMAACLLWYHFDKKDLFLTQENHDSLLLQLRADDWPRLLKEALDILGAITFNVTDIKGVTREVSIPWDAAIGSNWGPWSKNNPAGLRDIKRKNLC